MAAMAPVWTVTAVSGAGSFTGVSCPSPALCVAVDDAGNAVTSTAPAAGRWNRRHLESAVHLRSNRFAFADVSCASRRLCVAVDFLNRVWTTKDPVGGARKRTGKVDPPGMPGALNAVSCAPGPVCVIVDGAGNAITSTNPLSGKWKRARLERAALTDVSCVSRSFCVVDDLHGHVLTSSRPVGSARAWKPRRVSGGQLHELSCAADGFCAASNFGRKLFYSTHAASGGWHAVDFNPTRGTVTALACRSRSLCVSFVSNVALSSASPTTAPWTQTSINDTNSDGNPASVNDVSCPSDQLCVGADDAGNRLSQPTRSNEPR